MQSRTHTCGELRLSDAGKEVTLCGWMENFREVGSGLGFVVLRDFYGVTQLVAETEEMVAKFKSITKESTIQISGRVRERHCGRANEVLGTCLLDDIRAVGKAA